MLKTIRENFKHSLPMRTFEVSDVAFKDEVTDPQRCARNERHVTAVYANKSANFEIVHGLLDRLMRSLDVPHIGQGDKQKSKGYYLKASDNPTYFPGRAASIYYRAPPQAPATTDDLSSHGPPAAPILDSAVTSKAASGSTDLEQPKATSASEKVSDVLSSAVESMGKALADVLGGTSQTSLARRLHEVGGKGDIEIGHIGVLHPEVLAAFDLSLPCSAMEFDLEVFL
jgi:phenylalanyl-tRNA synthetase beta chain